MKSSAWRSVLRREWQALRANPWELALMSWWPLLLLAILWWTLAAGLPHNLPLVWVDHDKSASSRQLLQLLESSPTLSLSLRVPDEMAAMHEVRSGHAVGWLVVPRDFERDIKRGVAPTVHLQVNAQQSTGAGMVKSQVQTVLAVFSSGAELKIRTAQGESGASAMNNLEPLRPGLMTLFNGSMNYEAFLVPALGTAVLQLFAMFIAVACVGRELKHGTVSLWLEHSGANLMTALAAKLLINLAPLALLTCAMLFGLSFIRGFVIEGSLSLLLLAHLLGLIANATLGVVAVLAARSLRMGLSVAGIIASPAFTYSGAGYPLMAMPLAAQVWSWILPLTHLLRVQAEQWGMGAPVIYSLDDIAVLAAMAIIPWLAVPWLMSRCLSVDAWGRA